MSNIYRYSKLQRFHFIPKHLPATANDVKNLYDFIYGSEKLLVLTGAGVSTESGIPDYRSEGVGLYSMKRTRLYRPIQHSEFVSDSYVRQRYWLRNYIGWPSFSIKKPNSTHLALTKLEMKAKLVCIVTQNVDHLHLKARSKNVIELHGSAFRVKCLGCGLKLDRDIFQETLTTYNSDISGTNYTMNPDGDVDIDEVWICFYLTK